MKPEVSLTLVTPDQKPHKTSEIKNMIESPLLFYRSSSIQYPNRDRNLWSSGGFLYHGDSLRLMDEILAAYGEGWMDGIVVDPPYGIEFLKDWDSFKENGRSPHIVSGEKMGGYSEGKHFKNGLPRFSNQTPDDMLNFQAWTYEWGVRALKLCKPGARIASFAGTRTYHHMAVAIEAAGWEPFDMGEWQYWSGFPKSGDYGRAAQKRYEVAWGLRPVKKGAQAQVYPHRQKKFLLELEAWVGAFAPDFMGKSFDQQRIAYVRFLMGKGNALKPAHEPFFLGRKPSKKANYLSGFWLNIDKCRIPYRNMEHEGIRLDHLNEPIGEVKDSEVQGVGIHRNTEVFDRPWMQEQRESGEVHVCKAHPDGRYPSNIHIEEDYANRPTDHPEDNLSHVFAKHGGSMMTGENVEVDRKREIPWSASDLGRFPDNILLPSQTGEMQSIKITPQLLMELGAQWIEENAEFLVDNADGRVPINSYYCPKPAESEKGAYNEHVTVKPEGLMRWLLTLLFEPAQEGVPGQIVGDFFTGSGPVPKVCEELGLRWIACDQDRDACSWTTTRVRRYLKNKEKENRGNDQDFRQRLQEVKQTIPAEGFLPGYHD